MARLARYFVAQGEASQESRDPRTRLRLGEVAPRRKAPTASESRTRGIVRRPIHLVPARTSGTARPIPYLDPQTSRRMTLSVFLNEHVAGQLREEKTFLGRRLYDINGDLFRLNVSDLLSGLRIQM